MYSVPKTSKILHWGLSLGVVTLCLMLTAGALKGQQVLKQLFNWDKPAPASAPASADASDGGYLANRGMTASLVGRNTIRPNCLRE